MCGLAGFLDIGRVTTAEHGRAIVKDMTDAIRHRGPDHAGRWTDPEAGIALGHRRLSILDLSPAGHQPMVSHEGRYVVVYNGEIYNFQEIRKALEDEGCCSSWHGHSDTEVMLAAFTAWGIEKSVSRFNGMFAFALWDRRERSLVLARDRASEKPLYYGWQGQTLLFGSELKALAVHPAWRATVDRDSLAAYLRYSYVPAPWSIWRDIRKVPPGTFLTFSANSAPGDLPQPRAYWSATRAAELGAAAPLGLNEVQAADELDHILRQAVRLRMVADVPLGAFLSGGVDSSTVVALMQAQSTQPVRTFTVGFNEPGYNEAENAKAVARHLGTNHTELYVTPRDALDVVPLLPTIYDEPFSDVSQIPTYLVSRLARQHVTVSLSGDAGDELFGGYNRYFELGALRPLVDGLPLQLRRLGATAFKALPIPAWDAIGTSYSRRWQRPTLGDKLHKVADICLCKMPIYLLQSRFALETAI
jgi:asparagine synthase (glutamine-hydrolysing)